MKSISLKINSGEIKTSRFGDDMSPLPNQCKFCQFNGLQQRYINKSRCETTSEFNVLEENKRIDKFDKEQKNVHNQNKQVRWNRSLFEKNN